MYIDNSETKNESLAKGKMIQIDSMLFLRTFKLYFFITFIYFSLRTQLKKEIFLNYYSYLFYLLKDISSLGRYIIYVYEKMMQLWKFLNRIKEENRIKV